MRWAESAPRVSINTNQWQVGICPLLKQHLAVPVHRLQRSHQSQCTHMHRHLCSVCLPLTHSSHTDTHQKKLNKCGNRCPTSDCICPLLPAQLQGDSGIPLTKIRHCGPLLSLPHQHTCVENTLSFLLTSISVPIRRYQRSVGRAYLFFNPHLQITPVLFHIFRHPGALHSNIQSQFPFLRQPWRENNHSLKENASPTLPNTLSKHTHAAAPLNCAIMCVIQKWWR